MEEIPLEDEDGTSVEYRVLKAYVEHWLSANKYDQPLEGGTKGREQPSLTRKGAHGVTPKAPQEKPLEDLKPLAERKSQKKKKKKRGSSWKCLFLPPCLQGQTEEHPWESEINGKLPEYQGRKLTSFSPELQVESDQLEQIHKETKVREDELITEDSSITRVAARLAELVDNSKSCSKTIEGRGLARGLSLEEDGRGASKSVFEGSCEDDGKDNKEKILDTIVALLRKSGDEFQEKMQKDKAFFLSFRELMSYSFFSRIANRFLEEVPLDSARDSEAQVQNTKAAYVMEVTSRLSAVDSHPMNLLLGFGTKYLKENFRPWVCSQGGWENALGLSDQEEVE